MYLLFNLSIEEAPPAGATSAVGAEPVAIDDFALSGVDGGHC
jgi:hypothetical protein